MTQRSSCMEFAGGGGKVPRSERTGLFLHCLDFTGVGKPFPFLADMEANEKFERLHPNECDCEAPRACFYGTWKKSKTKMT